MSQLNQNDGNKKNSRWPSGPQVSVGTIIASVIFLAILVAAAIIMDSYFILIIVAIPIAIVAIKRLIGGQSLTSLLTAGDDYNDDYRIDGGLVSVERDGDSWHEPLSHYEGVLWHLETVRRRRGMSRRNRRQDQFQILELRHGQDRARDVNIYTSREATGMRARWEESARAFDLPALRDLGDGRIVRRRPGDLDKSLRQLAREGRLDETFANDPSDNQESGVFKGLDLRPIEQVDPAAQQERWAQAADAFNPNAAPETPPDSPPGTPPDPSDKAAAQMEIHYDSDAPVPSGVRWTHSGDVLDIRLRKAAMPYLIMALPVALIALLVGYLVPADPLITVIVIAVPALLFWLWLLVDFRVRVTPRGVTIGGRLGPFPLWQRTASLDEVEEVLIGEAILSSAAILVESDRVTLRVGPLGDESAAWLARFLRFAIAYAPGEAEASMRPENNTIQRD